MIPTARNMPIAIRDLSLIAERATYESRTSAVIFRPMQIVRSLITQNQLRRRASTYCDGLHHKEHGIARRRHRAELGPGWGNTTIELAGWATK